MMTQTRHYPEGRGPHTPWGSAQHVKPFGRGVAEVGTAGHGGIRVSRALAESRISPAVLKQAIFQGNYYWFEEDCAYGLVVLSMPQLFDEKMHEYAHGSVKTWFPDEYTLITGRPVELEESYVLQKRKFEKETHNRFVVRSAVSSEKFPGMVEVWARRACDGAEMTTFVSAEEYKNRSRFGYILPEVEEA